MMEHEFITTTTHLLLALVAGSLIGLERTIHGRPAGFRTHALVCISSAALMLVSIFQWDLVSYAPVSTIRVDPTRMAQGIMTGIGFLGAGVILKERATIRGLTTAASIWLTAAIGIAIGMGLYFAAFLSLLLALMVLIIFRRVEHYIPNHQYGGLRISFARLNHLSEADLKSLISEHNIKCFDISYHLENEGKLIKYDIITTTMKQENYRHLFETLSDMEIVQEFSLHASRQ